MLHRWISTSTLLVPIGSSLRLSSEFQSIYRNLNYYDGDLRKVQPSRIAVELLPFQQQGVGWMMERESHGRGGIMADHLGMGKTVQMIALCVASADPHQKKLVPSTVSRATMEAQAYRIVTVARQLQKIPSVGNCSKITQPGKDLFRIITDVEAAVSRREETFTSFMKDLHPWLEFTKRYFPSFERRAQTFLSDQHATSFDEITTPELRTLVIVPAPLIHQWEQELKAKIDPSMRLNIFVYHGHRRKASATELESYDFVLTTYDTVWRLGESAFTRKGTDEVSFDRGQADGLFQVRWKRIILDEAHVVRNPLSLRWMAIDRLEATKKWAVTATPLHNSITDLQTLLKFIGNPALPVPKTGNASAALLMDPVLQRSVARALSPVLLRRSPIATVNGVTTVHVQLPPKHESVVKLNLSRSEALEYNDILARGKSQMANHPTSATHVLAMMIRLRQTCLHSWLAEGRQLKAFLCESCRNPAVDPVLTKCGHAFCFECLSSKFTEVNAKSGDAVRIPCPSCEASISNTVFKRNQSSHARITAMRSKEWKSSTKVDAVMNCVRNVIDNHGDDKIVVFSHFTAMLDVLTIALEKSSISHLRLDGTMHLEVRNSTITRFKNENIRVMLASKLAVGVGLNLTAANHVIVADPWWNPAVEEQSVHRCHRIGQTKAVHITRLVTSDTIEDYCFNVALKKKEFGDAVLEAATQETALPTGLLAGIRELEFVKV